MNLTFKIDDGERQEVATVRIGTLAVLPRLLDSLGLDGAEVLQGGGFRPDEFRDYDHRVNYLRLSRLLEHCVTITGRDDLGLLLAQRATPSHLGIVGFLARAASTVEGALRALIAHVDLHDDASMLSLNVSDGYAFLNFNIGVGGARAVEQIYDHAAAMMFQFVAMLCGENHCVSGVYIPRHKPADPSAYTQYFGAPVHFNSPGCSIAFPSACLAKSTPDGDDLLFQFLEEEAQFMHGLHSDDLLEALPQALRRGLIVERYKASDIADLFGMHERTLHRRLRTAGTSFRQELDRTRMSICEELLGGTELSVAEIAGALGYSESSGFIRAFRRWRGTSPESWRKRHNDSGLRAGH